MESILKFAVPLIMACAVIIGADMASATAASTRLSAATVAPAASGGGCGQWVAEPNFSIKACVSMSGLRVVTAGFLATNVSNTHCRIDVIGYGGGQYAGESEYPCNSTSFDGPSWFSVASSAQTVVQLKINGSVQLTAYSLIQNT